MFQTELNLWLQAYGGPLVTRILWLVSELGRPNAYLALMILVTFGLDLRRGWLLGQVLLWTAGLTELGKQTLALPRPHDVDSRVVYPPTGEPTQQVFEDRGGASFLAGLPRDVIDYYRARGGVAWGLPSGHTTTATACWGSLAVLLGARRWWVAAGLAALLMGLSRLYLGRHFLADVIVGAALGWAVVLVLRGYLARRPGRVSMLEARASDLARWAAGRSFLLYAFVAPALLLPFAWITADFWAAQLWGWNLAFWLLLRRGRDYAGGRPGQRLLRVVLGLALAAASVGAARLILELGGWTGSVPAELAGHGLAVLVLTLATTLASEALGLYESSGRPTGPAGRPGAASGV